MLVFERCASLFASRDNLLELFLIEIFLFVDKGVGLDSDDKDERDVPDETELSEISRDSL